MVRSSLHPFLDWMKQRVDEMDGMLPLRHAAPPRADREEIRGGAGMNSAQATPPVIAVDAGTWYHPARRRASAGRPTCDASPPSETGATP